MGALIPQSSGFGLARFLPGAAPAGRRFRSPLRRKIGGRLVIPVGADQRVRELVRVTRVSENEYRSEDRKVRRARVRRALRPLSREEETLVRNLADAPESFSSIEGLTQSLDGADLKPSSRGTTFRTNPPQQFDEYVWFDETGAVTLRDTAEIKSRPDTYPFGV